jgi:hypothetical protein
MIFKHTFPTPQTFPELGSRSLARSMSEKDTSGNSIEAVSSTLRHALNVEGGDGWDERRTGNYRSEANQRMLDSVEESVAVSQAGVSGVDVH